MMPIASARQIKKDGKIHDINVTEEEEATYEQNVAALMVEYEQYVPNKNAFIEHIR